MEFDRDRTRDNPERGAVDSLELYGRVSEKKDSKSKKKKRKNDSDSEASNLPVIVSKEGRDELADQPKKPSLLDRLWNRDDDDPDKDTSEGSREESTELPEGPAQEYDDTFEPELPDDLKELSDDETYLVLQDYLDTRANRLQKDLQAVEPNGVEYAETLANAAFVDKVTGRLDIDDPVALRQLDQLVAETIEELGTQPEGSLEDQPLPAEANTVPADVPPIADQQTGLPPLPEFTVDVPKGNNPSRRKLVGGTVTDVVPSEYLVADTAPRSGVEEPEKHVVQYNSGGGLLVLGYLLGRRRGRIKTEKRMKPVQKSLEKKVKNLQWQVGEREKKVRKLTVEKVGLEGKIAQKHIVKKAEAVVAKKPLAKEAPKASKTLTSKDSFLVARQADRIQPKPKIEAGTKPQKKLAKKEVNQVKHPELHEASEVPHTVEGSVAAALAAVAVAREQSSHTHEVPAKPKQAKPRLQPARSMSIQKNAKTMPERELLHLARKIKFKDTNVKNLYEQGRLDRKDLRRVVGEYMSNRSDSWEYKRVLNKKLKPVGGPEHGIEAKRSTKEPRASVTPSSDKRTAKSTERGSSKKRADSHALLASSIDSIVKFGSDVQSARPKAELAPHTVTTIVVVSAIGLMIFLLGVLTS